MPSLPFLTKTIASLPIILGASTISLAMISPVLSQSIQVAQREEFNQPGNGNSNNSPPRQAPNTTAVNTSLSGIWHYDENGQRMSDVKMEQDGDRITMILSYESGPITLKGTRTGNKFRVPFRKSSHVYKGTISSDGNRVEGTFILRGEEIPFVLQRVTTQTNTTSSAPAPVSTAVAAPQKVLSMNTATPVTNSAAQLGRASAPAIPSLSGMWLFQKLGNASIETLGNVKLQQLGDRLQIFTYVTDNLDGDGTIFGNQIQIPDFACNTSPLGTKVCGTFLGTVTSDGNKIEGYCSDCGSAEGEAILVRVKLDTSP